MGIIADLHHGLEPRAMSLLKTFIGAANEQNAGCIIQLGDFNYGKPESRECIDLWNTFKGAKYHVLGNHDMDFYDKEHMVEFWSMPGRYYSFDRGGYHFVILDRNNLKTPVGYIPYAKGNFYVDPEMRAHADPEQLEWLKADLRETELPAIVFMHQGLGMDTVYKGAQAAIETIFEQVNSDAGLPKVAACFCGHHHIDRYNFKNGIHYVWINSISYYWIGEKYGRMAPYRDPLFAFITFRSNGIEIEGRTTTWESPTPEERGYPQAEKLTPYISHRELRHNF